MKRFKILAICCILVFASSVFAGVVSKPGIFYSAYNPTSASYVFDSAGGTGVEIGWAPASGFQSKTILFMITTQASTTIHLLIQGRSAGLVGQIYQKDYSAATTYAEVIVITGAYEQIRVGLKVTTNGADSVTATYLFEKWE